MKHLSQIKSSKNEGFCFRRRVPLPSVNPIFLSLSLSFCFFFFFFPSSLSFSLYFGPLFGEIPVWSRGKNNMYSYGMYIMPDMHTYMRIQWENDTYAGVRLFFTAKISSFSERFGWEGKNTRSSPLRRGIRCRMGN